MTIVTPPPAIDRDRYERPMVVPPNGGKPVPYQRCTKYIEVLEDQFKLQQWRQRMVAIGLASRPDLLLSVSAHRDDKEALNKICDKAREAGKASAPATIGTALHALTELIDRGQDLPAGLPANVTASLDAYVAETKALRAIHIERFMVLDPLKVGGTPDRVVEYEGTRYIADLKTGNIEYGILKICMQLAVYARSWVYDIASHERTAHGADLTKALVIHLPYVEDPAEARCELHWVDILEGWDTVQTAKDVRAKRKLDRFHNLTKPFDDTAGFKAAEVNPEAANDRPIKRAGVARTPAEQVAQADSRAELESLWQAYTRDGTWTDELTAIAARRTTELQKLPTVA